MAENKDSFILYKDQIGIFSKLSDAKAGKLIKIILDYVNDKDPVIEDMLLQVAFEPIKMQLKRDLKNWEAAVENKSKSGRMGNLKRWHKDLYDQVVKQEIDIEMAEIIAKNRSATNGIANIAVNETVTDTVNVTEREAIPAQFRIEECLTVAMNDPRWVEANKVTKRDLEVFNRMLEGRGVYEKSPLDYKTHYYNWNKGGRKEESIVNGKGTTTSFRELKGQQILDEINKK